MRRRKPGRSLYKLRSFLHRMQDPGAQTKKGRRQGEGL